MPSFKGIVDLFTGGAVAVAEQFIRGTTAIKDFAQLMISKFGDDYNVSKPDEKDFISTVTQAMYPAGEVMEGLLPDESKVPSWLGYEGEPTFIHRGLAQISAINPSGDEPFSTHIPISFAEHQILTYEQILQRIDDALDRDILGGLDYYGPDIDRIEALVKYLKIAGFGSKASFDLYTIFKANME